MKDKITKVTNGIINKWYESAKKGKKFVGLLFSIVGFLSCFISLNELFPENTKIVTKLHCVILITLAVFILATALIRVCITRRKTEKLLDVGNNKHVYLYRGDMFEDAFIHNKDIRHNIVIPANTDFDILVDNDLVSEETIHGQAVEKIERDFGIDSETLYKRIVNSLDSNEENYEKLKKADKRKGNLRRYKTGAVAEVKADENCTFFFLALSTFDRCLHANTSKEDYVVSLQSLIEYVLLRSQTLPVVVPVIGTGASNVNISQDVSLKMMLQLIEIYKDDIKCDIYIVIRK